MPGAEIFLSPLPNHFLVGIFPQKPYFFIYFTFKTAPLAQHSPSPSVWAHSGADTGHWCCLIIKKSRGEGVNLRS